jgi:homoserine dehydrogenase
MENTIKVALLGLGEIGQEFAEHFLEIIQERRQPVEIVAVSDTDTGSPIALGFAHSGVPVLQDPLEIIAMGESVDVIFDLTGDPEKRQQLRQALADAGNRHTVLVPEVMARLVSLFFDTDSGYTLAAAGGY